VGRIRPVWQNERSVNDDDRLAFVLEHTRLAPVPLAPELSVYRAEAVTPVWFETARWLGNDDADVPFWCVPWAGGQALARYVLDHPELVRGKRVVDFACGGGLVAIAASRAGAHVLACDIDPFARVVTRLNAEANGLPADAIAIAIADLVGSELADVDVLLAGDVWYEPAPSARFRRWFRRLAPRMPVLTADSGRPYAPKRVTELARYDVPTPFELEARSTRIARVLTFSA
jgi:predicted nicotinamide N-methyase